VAAAIIVFLLIICIFKLQSPGLAWCVGVGAYFWLNKEKEKERDWWDKHEWESFFKMNDLYLSDEEIDYWRRQYLGDEKEKVVKLIKLENETGERLTVKQRKLNDELDKMDDGYRKEPKSDKERLSERIKELALIKARMSRHQKE
jgi:hypothetical protein